MELSDIESYLWQAKEVNELMEMRIDKLEEQTLELEWAMKKLLEKMKAIDQIFERAVKK